MKTASAYLAKQSPLALAGAAAVVLVVGYYLLRQGVKDAAAGVAAVGETVVDTGAGILTGNNVITQNQKNASGETVDAYQGYGILGTLGAATNSVLGGIPASIGETLGGWTFDIFGPKRPD